jgi:hypothetical protein
MKYSFNSLSLSSVNLNIYPQDFQIEFKNTILNIPSLIAELISPIISSIRSRDSSIQKYQIDLNISEKALNQISTLFSGHEISLQSSDEEVIHILLKLGHKNILSTSIYSNITIENVYYLIQIKKLNKIQYSKEIEFYSEHFEELKNNDISINILEEILSNPKFHISDENSFFKYLHSKITEDIKFFILLKYIHFEFLTKESFDLFISLIDNLETTDIGSLWPTFKRYLIKHLPTPFLPKESIASTYSEKILSWLPQNSKSSLLLLFKASRDGFSASKFHQLCDNKGATLTIIKSSNNYLFGGYTPLSWKNSGSYQQDNTNSSFIFTLTNPYNIEPTKFSLKTPQYAICCNSNYLPTFGSGHDIHLCDNCNSQNSSYTGFSVLYTNTTGKGNAIFTGSQNFTTLEIEVYQIS